MPEPCCKSAPNQTKIQKTPMDPKKSSTPGKKVKHQGKKRNKIKCHKKPVSKKSPGDESSLQASNEVKVKAPGPSKSELLRRKEARLKLMFSSSFDPYDQPLGWWQQEHVKYA
ncbi:hypothetical protein QAD02_005212 [Eretmocerus hayati]|uniref:Uncharacterized protein n=1 Tax=Eretmocerus hayati TaxID=131215 RepID=A0ACC2NWL7_9HYME|nr:hypothetical protein QAD02_005212 [Eretmocerus hayati]